MQRDFLLFKNTFAFCEFTGKFINLKKSFTRKMEKFQKQLKTVNTFFFFR